MVVLPPLDQYAGLIWWYAMFTTSIFPRVVGLEWEHRVPAWPCSVVVVCFSSFSREKNVFPKNVEHVPMPRQESAIYFYSSSWHAAKSLILLERMHLLDFTLFEHVLGILRYMLHDV